MGKHRAGGLGLQIPIDAPKEAQSARGSIYGMVFASHCSPVCRWGVRGAKKALAADRIVFCPKVRCSVKAKLDSAATLPNDLRTLRECSG